MIVRREHDGDRAEVERIVAAAFANDGDIPIEVGLLNQLRRSAGWIPELSLVAVRDSEIVGHVICTQGVVGAREALGLGPIAVAPSYQRQGIGSALMHAVLGAADCRGESLVALLGNPAFYSKFGFRVSTDHGIDSPDPAWGEFFQVRTLTAFDPATSGQFEYAEPFSRLGD